MLALAKLASTSGDIITASQLAEQPPEVDLSNPGTNFLSERNLLFSAGVDDPRAKWGAVEVEKKYAPVTVLLSSGKTKIYLVKWIETFDPQKPVDSEHNSQPRCEWKIDTKIYRTVYELGPDGRLKVESKLSKVFGRDNPPVYPEFQNDLAADTNWSDTCANVNARYLTRLSQSRLDVGNLWNSIVVGRDYEALKSEMGQLPGVETVTLDLSYDTKRP
jgi:hypothetical protein